MWHQRSEGAWQDTKFSLWVSRTPFLRIQYSRFYTYLKFWYIFFVLSRQEEEKICRLHHSGLSSKELGDNHIPSTYTGHLLSKVSAWGTRHQSLIPPFSTPHSHVCTQRSDSMSDPFPLAHKLSKKLTNVLMLLYSPHGSVYWISISHIHKFVFYGCKILTP